MTQEPQHSKPNGGFGALIQMASRSGDKWIQLAIIILVALSGGGNWFATSQNGTGVNRAIAEIHNMHLDWDAGVARQKEINNDVKTALKRQDDHSAETLAILQRIEQKLNK